jgi:hypothetical protein
MSIHHGAQYSAVNPAPGLTPLKETDLNGGNINAGLNIAH